MKRKTIALMMILIASLVFISGCTSTNQGTAVKTPEDVKKTVADVNTNIDNVGSTLNDISSKLG